MEKKDDVSVLIPTGDGIPLDSGEKVYIKPFAFVKLPQVVKLINRIGVGVFALFEVRNSIQVQPGEQADGTATLEIDDLVINKVNTFIEEHFDEVVEVLSIYCRRPKEFFLDEEKGPNVEEVCQIILTIIDRHLGFFTKTLQPIIASIQNKAKK